VRSAFIVGDYAKGIDSGIIDLVLVGRVDQTYLQKLIDKVEPLIHRKIRFLTLSEDELERFKTTLRVDEGIALVSDQ
jgi:hypothetical protein